MWTMTHSSIITTSEAATAMICKFLCLCLWSRISEPPFSVEDYYLTIIGDGGELILLICDVLQGDYSVLGYERVIVPKGLGVREGISVVMFDGELLLVGAHCIKASLP
jgi:hypothetical protein